MEKISAGPIAAAIYSKAGIVAWTALHTKMDTVLRGLTEQGDRLPGPHMANVCHMSVIHRPQMDHNNYEEDEGSGLRPPPTF